MKKFLIIDGNSILNRAYYGIRALSASDGLPTNALYGFVNTVLSTLDRVSPDYAAIAFDLPGKTFRHEKFDQYKANRHGMPDDLAIQLPYAKKLAEALGFRVAEKSGYEGDDVIGTLAKTAAEAGVHAYILTGDRDSLQLVCGNISVLLIGNRETLEYTPDVFLEKYGIPAEHYVDCKALMGDSSDNIPGVPGIGEKTAFKLIAEYKTLDDLYDKYESSSLTAGVKKKLAEGKDSAYTSRFLARIVTDAPLDITLEDCGYSGADGEKLTPLLQRLEFSAFMRKISVREPEKKPTECEVIPTEKLTGGTLENGAVYGLYTAEKDGGFYAYIYDGSKCFFCEKSEPVFSDIFSGRYKLCVYDGKTLSHALSSFGIEYFGWYYDIMLAAYVADASGRNYSLSELAYSLLGEYCGESPERSACLCLRLFGVYENKLDADEKALLEKVELPLSELLYKMEKEGFKTDVEGLKIFNAFLEEKCGEYVERVYARAGEVFNLNSPKQLGEILFEKLSIPSPKKKGKNGWSTSAEILEKAAPYHPIIFDILEYRKLAKLKSTYCDGLLKVADENGKIHSTFNQTVTATGRLSSSEPNLQNIPIRTELGREMRRFFIPKSEDRVLIDADYSQIELRLLASVSGDENMIAQFNEGRDIHTATAAKIFRVQPEAVTPEMRKRAKAVNFGIVYGIGSFSLSQDIGVTVREAGEYIKQYMDNYPKVGEYLRNVVADAKRDGYTKTVFGRKRYIPELRSSKKPLVAFGERVAMNSPIQGTAADLMKIAMINTDAALEREGLDAHIILTVHDELILDSAKECADKAAEIMKTEMENAGGGRFAVKLTAEVGTGANWYEAH
ncbi:MAG: DNA polymerase I [Clostridia bacterium]|nr:DNA polymerase I [Clostridia bacterium]